MRQLSAIVTVPAMNPVIVALPAGPMSLSALAVAAAPNPGWNATAKEVAASFCRAVAP